MIIVFIKVFLLIEKLIGLHVNPIIKTMSVC